MKTRVLTIFGLGSLIIIGIYFALPPTMTVILCDDKTLNLDDCGPYLEEKYSDMPEVRHFRELYPDPPGLGFASDKFKAISVSATSSMEEKRLAELEISLEDYTITYRCYDHNLSDEKAVTVAIASPTIEDMNNNYCLEKRK
ncbi:hypothetical protein [Nitrosopumilus sp.]|uniref:hypothetical protein n=1 Tax=Nitrosopumilus sp. TaxID=2024843 RepID=UPI003B59D4E3